MDTKLMLLLLFLTFHSANSTGFYVNPTVVKSDAGAVCLTGKPASYYLAPGFDKGIHNWLIFLPGGGWCTSASYCINYAIGRKANEDPKRFYFNYILSNDKETNPDFYNWNKALITYCDGSSFTGDSQTIYNRSSANSLPKSCTSRLSPDLCFFAQNLQKDIKTPISFLMSAFDTYQVSWTFPNNVAIQNCFPNNTCSSEIIKILQDLRVEFLSLLPKKMNSLSRGVLITSGQAHGQTRSVNWNLNMVINGRNETISKLFGDWYFDRRGVHIIDNYSYPCPNNCSAVLNH